MTNYNIVLTFSLHLLRFVDVGALRIAIITIEESRVMTKTDLKEKVLIFF